MNRSSGILMPLSSLPSPYGIGTMGDAAYQFVNFLSEAKQRWWQLLPLGPTSYGDSPYASPSSFAGNPYYIDLDYLVRDGLLKKGEPEAVCWGTDPGLVDYGAIYENRFNLLRNAFSRAPADLQTQILAFRENNRAWIENYALYMAVKTRFSMRPWTEWPEDIRLRTPSAVENYSRLLREEVDFWVFTQFLFFRQWDALRQYAKENGIGFIGDIPIYVAMDSADVWSEPEFFQLKADGTPSEVSGVPPDDFTADGQLWGNPLYDWTRMAGDGYGWWIRRVDGASRLYDILRIDHFRGLSSYWAVPAGETTAKNGVWRKGPGMGLVRVLTNWFSSIEYIAEDLGYPTPEVSRLLSDSALPGMKVLQFGFEVNGDSSHMPHHIPENSVCYVGTHDNNTALGWRDSLDAETLAFVNAYTHHTDGETWCRCLLRTGMATSAKLFVLTMQDALELPGACRMNTPGLPQGNWRWRMLPQAADSRLAEQLAELTLLYRRAPLPEASEEPVSESED